MGDELEEGMTRLISMLLFLHGDHRRSKRAIGQSSSMEIEEGKIMLAAGGGGSRGIRVEEGKQSR